MKNKTTNIYTEWLPLINGLSNEEAGKLFKDILRYQNNEIVDNKNPIWLFIKSKIDDYNDNGKQISKSRSEAGKLGMARRWSGITKDNKNNKCYQMITNDNKNNNKIKENKIKENKYIYNKLNNYGELGNVCLTEQDYIKLSKEYPLFLEAVEKLDGWLDTKGGEKNKNRNHRCYFKKNSWVWENLKPMVKKEDDSFLEEMSKQQNERLGLE